jgi:ADP-ribose pyrophosphatase YjhB (NUDIX family)
MEQLRERYSKSVGTQPRVPAGSPSGGQWAGGHSGGSGASSSKPSSGKPHPRVDDKGQPVTITSPTKPTDSSSWHAADKTATFVPDGATPKSLMGVAMKPWTPPTTAAGWAKVEGQDPTLDHAPPQPVRGKSVAAGVVVMEPDGRVWLVKPTNNFAGYSNTFPKGTMEPGMSLQATAIKEVYEESGLKVKLTGLLGDFERPGSVARYYVGQRTGGTPAKMGWESQAVRLAAPEHLGKLLNASVDRKIADTLMREARIGKAFSIQQPRWPAGTPLGGQWLKVSASGIVMPPHIGGGTANPQYQKKADQIFAHAEAGNHTAVKDMATALAQKVEASKLKAKTNSHDSWNAKLSQYANAVADTSQQTHTAVAVADKIDGPLKLSEMTHFAPKPGGQSPGAIYKDANGETWLVKGNAQLQQGNVSQTVSDDRARNEVTAAHLFNAAGTQAPEMKLVELGSAHGGGLGVASKMIAGMSPFDIKNGAQLAAAQQTFAAQVWLRNHDALGNHNDNITISKDGKGIAVDPGGALGFKGWGLPKPDGVPDHPSEWTSMRDKSKAPTAAPTFGSMTQSQLQASAKPLASVGDDQIKKIVDTYGPGSKEQKAKLAESLIKRRDAILDMAGLDKAGNPKVVAPPPQPVQPPTPPAAAIASHPTASHSQFPPPTFNTGFASANAVYDKLAADMVAAHAAGDAAKIQALKVNAVPGPHISANGQKLIDYADKLTANLNSKAVNVATQNVAPGSLAPNPNVAQPGTAKPVSNAAMPLFENHKISGNNQNAGSHNAKVETIAKLAMAGNINGILALNYSTNTYGVKQHYLANDTLKALGSPHMVTPGQKKGAHPALQANFNLNQTAIATANAATAAVAPPGGATPPAAKVPVLDPSKLPKPPDYNTSGQGGKPMHGAQWKNDANNAEGAHIQSLALGPKPVEALNAYTIKSPSKYLQAYKDQLLTEIDSQLNPPAPIVVHHAAGADVHTFAGKSPYPVGTAYTSIKPQERLAFYAAVAIIKTQINWSDKESVQSEQWVKDGYKEYDNSSAVTKAGISVQQGNPHQFRGKSLQSKIGGSGYTLHEMMKHWDKDAKIVPEGTKLYRYVGLTKEMKDQMLAAEPGTVLQDLSPGAASRDNGRNNTFGGSSSNSKIEFITLSGVRAIKSYGSKGFQNEMETTLMPGQRFMIHKVTKRANGGVKIKAILLPTQSPV